MHPISATSGAKADDHETTVAQDPTTPPPARLLLTPAASVVTPHQIELTWPRTDPGRSLVDLLLARSDDVPVDTLDMLLAAIPGLLLDVHRWHEQGAAVLAPWSLRLVNNNALSNNALSLWCAPGLGGTVDWPDPLRHLSLRGPAADLHALGLIVHRMASGHWASSSEQAVVEAGVLGGEWPLGTEPLVRACLHPDPGRRARSAGDLHDRVLPFLAPELHGEPFTGGHLQVADESVTGWAKTRGRPDGDNEDAVAWDWTADGMVATVLDGVSGSGDGSGRWASRALRDNLVRLWRDGVWEPEQALRTAVDAMGSPPQGLAPDGCTVGLCCRVSGGRLTWVLVGDCRLYLVRAAGAGVAACRVTPEHSLSAGAMRAGRPVDPGTANIVTSALPAPDRGWWSGSLELRQSDVLLATTDGACRGSANDEGEGDWQFNDVLESIVADVRDTHAPRLVSLLCRRAEELGGEDNATALAVVCGPPPELAGERSRRSSVGVERPAMIASE